jgi:hypothetical protein
MRQRIIGIDLDGALRSNISRANRRGLRRNWLKNCLPRR